ncbi:cyclic nucleotide-binding domain-containing protein [Rhizobium sp. S-51]|jgi:CRP/FNR family transcriptional activator FtrB|uniref:Cyclic nucleotide-binding domain-containing protein n=1 Tax=Rhizobium terricola TaxID=2728849 RepID=A0A7Y0FX50_9HYPH|nr:cyclic nucleotide-binding domain-containing protein [Rhizobium terricola]NML76182.1 cyclic nucleotide-binding domain-containing protein [Rhizobium terricola]
MRAEDTEKLKCLNFFRGVKENTFRRAIAPSFLQSFPAGTILLEENRPADFLYIVLDGLVEMSSSAAGDETVIEILGPVNLFILAAVLNNDICLQSARTLTPARILMIPANLIRELLSEDHDFMKAVVFELASAYRRTIKELKNQKLRSGTERLANWLLREERGQGGEGRLTIPYEKRILAAYLGMTAENLSRGFSALSAHGVQIKGLQVDIVDIGKLSDYARSSPLIDDGEPPLPRN